MTAAQKGLKVEKTHWAQKIDTPPYYLYPLRPSVTFTYMGVKVDKQAQVFDEKGGKFDNIFAVGEIIAGNILTKGYVAGFGMSIGGVFAINALSAFMIVNMRRRMSLI